MLSTAERRSLRAVRARWVTPKRTLVVIATIWTALALTVAVATPPWEANDEPDHVQNVETLLSGRWYRIKPGGGFEPQQAPLYYLVLAGWQKLFGSNPRMPAPVFQPASAGVMHGNYQHDVPNDGADQREVTLLRLPGVLFGLGTILLAAASARRLSADPWTPAVAAALVAAVPKFAFVSGVVNNDNLANVIGALVVLLSIACVVAPPATRNRRLLAAGFLGLALGAVILTKVTAATLGVGALVAILLSARDRREWPGLVAVFVLASLAVCGWWLVSNWVLYGDPLANGAFREYFRHFFPPLLATAGAFKQAFDVVPKDFYKSFWYDSGHNQFVWHWWVYLPFWGLTIAALAGFAVRRPRVVVPRRAVVVLVLLALGAISTVWILGIQTTTSQGRLAFIGLAAIACLLALGLERWPGPVIIRFALPVLGLLCTLIAIQRDIFNVYYH